MLPLWLQEASDSASFPLVRVYIAPALSSPHAMMNRSGESGQPTSPCCSTGPASQPSSRAVQACTVPPPLLLLHSFLLPPRRPVRAEWSGHRQVPRLTTVGHGHGGRPQHRSITGRLSGDRHGSAGHRSAVLLNDELLCVP